MFVLSVTDDAEAAPVVDAAAVQAMVERLTEATGPVGIAPEIDAERVELIRALEDLKNAAAGLQVAVTEAFDTSQCAQQAEARVPAEKVGQGVAAQVALARRCSPHRGRRHLSLARVLRREMPHTHAALRAGRITELGATLVARGTVHLSREDRQHIDTEIAADPDRIERLGERGIEAEVARAAYRLDPVAVVERRRHAESERYVSLRPAPDTMTYLTALLPMADGVAVYAALGRAADEARSAGQPASRGQVMADALRDAVLSGRSITEALAGRSTDATAGTGPSEAAPVGDADAPESPTTRPSDVRGLPDGVAVVLDLVLTDTQLFRAR